MTTGFHSPGSIKYSREQVSWIIINCLDGNTWPRDFRHETGYVGGKGRTKGHTAPFVVTKCIVAELLSRLARTGLDGLALEFVLRLSDGDDVYLIQRVAGYQRRNYFEVKNGIRSALAYCCGWRRKRISYKRYCYLYRKRRENGSKT